MNNEQNKCHDCGRSVVTLHPVMRPLKRSLVTRNVVVGVCDECKSNQKRDQNENAVEKN